MGGDLPAPVRMEVSAASQLILVSWEPVDGADSYVVRVHDGQVRREYVTTGTECRVDAVNGRTYAVEVAAVDSAGVAGEATPAQPVRPALESDLLFLTLGLLSVWGGLFLYVFFLVRQQQQIARGFEALLGRAPPREPS